MMVAKSVSQVTDLKNGQWGFDGVDLGDSFVLSWEITAREIHFRIECSLWPGHPLYEVPSQDRYTCYKAGLLKFTSVIEANGLRKMSDCKPNPAANNTESEDYGSIDGLDRRSDGVWLVDGEFGIFQINSDTPVLETSGNQL